MSSASVEEGSGSKPSQRVLAQCSFGIRYLGLRIQRVVGQLCVLPLCAIFVLVIRYRFRLKVRGIPELRRRFLELTGAGQPVVICPNHLTMVDSMIITWALASIPTLALSYRRFPWNIPAIENFHAKPVWRVITYLGKCIPIDRGGSNEHINDVFAKLRFLLERGDLCMIFPEGGRSRTGRVSVETAGYGVGKLIREVPGCKVLCVYLRGDTQKTYSNMPTVGENYHLDMELITPTSDKEGLRAVREYSLQIIHKLKEMEDRYFAAREGAETEAMTTHQGRAFR